MATVQCCVCGKEWTVHSHGWAVVSDHLDEPACLGECFRKAEAAMRVADSFDARLPAISDDVLRRKLMASLTPARAAQISNWSRR